MCGTHIALYMRLIVIRNIIDIPTMCKHMLMQVDMKYNILAGLRREYAIQKHKRIPMYV